MAFKMKYGKGSFPYKSGSALKSDGPRSKFRQLRDEIKDDWYDVPRGSHYKGEKRDVVGRPNEPKESMIDMAKRIKAETEAKKSKGTA